ncbi:hypothetical protein [Stenoxybacter acetivorans]|uniref:hypothetical protein n=1 Tax=Stenoxybacter acetivorans TaxID=422441 RepID=UPI00055B12E0|nr:hypothetical protein [Stenoxybacter acetivorans]
MTWLAAFVSVAAAVFSIATVYVQQRRLITPPIDMQVFHLADGKHTQVKFQFGRLANQSYTLSYIWVIGIAPEKIVAVSNGITSKPKMIDPNSKVNFAIDIQAAMFNVGNQKCACQLVLIMEKPRETTALRIGYKTSFFPLYSWHELKVFPDDRIQL